MKNELNLQEKRERLRNKRARLDGLHALVQIASEEIIKSAEQAKESNTENIYILPIQTS